jgi:UDP-glucose 4-epimerase
MKVLVTGGAGFIGSHVCEDLVEKGLDVVVFDNLSTGKKSNLKKGTEIIKGDLREIADFKNELKNIDSILHLGAQTSVKKSIEEPIEDLHSNVIGTVAVLEFAKNQRIKEFRFISSAAVYGNQNFLPIDESASLNPSSIYGISKMTGEKLTELYATANRWGGGIFRLANVYGPRQRHDMEGGVVSIFVNDALTNRISSIYGDGSQTRDFVYVKDVASILTFKICDLRDFQVFNVGTSVETSIIDLWRTVKRNSGSQEYEYKTAHPRLGDISNSSLSNIRLQSVFGKFSFTKLDDGIRRFISSLR